MNPQEALRVLDVMTNPQNSGKATRVDYANAENALRALSEFIAQVTAPQPQMPPLSVVEPTEGAS